MVVPELVGFNRRGEPVWAIAGGGASQSEQHAYRGRKDNVALNSSTFDDPNQPSSTNLAENTPWTQPVDTNFRVRLKVRENNNKVEVVSGQLEASLNSTTVYQNVTTSSTIVKAVSSAQFSNDDATTELLSSTKTDNSPFGYGCHDGVTANISLQNTDMENEYVCQIIGTQVSNGDTVRLRISGLDVYTVVATITVSEPPSAAKLIVVGPVGL